MNALGQIIVPILMTILTDPTAAEIEQFKSTMLYVKNLIYFHLMTQYYNYIHATIKHMKTLS
jgi:hypothetical protein